MVPPSHTEITTEVYAHSLALHIACREGSQFLMSGCLFGSRDFLYWVSAAHCIRRLDELLRGHETGFHSWILRDNDALFEVQVDLNFTPRPSLVLDETSGQQSDCPDASRLQGQSDIGVMQLSSTEASGIRERSRHRAFEVDSIICRDEIKADWTHPCYVMGFPGINKKSFVREVDDPEPEIEAGISALLDLKVVADLSPGEGSFIGQLTGDGDAPDTSGVSGGPLCAVLAQGAQARAVLLGVQSQQGFDQSDNENALGGQPTPTIWFEYADLIPSMVQVIESQVDVADH